MLGNTWTCCVTLYFDLSRNVYAGNILKNGKVYCLGSVCICFVTILKFYFFFRPNKNWGGGKVWL